VTRGEITQFARRNQSLSERSFIFIQRMKELERLVQHRSASGSTTAFDTSPTHELSEQPSSHAAESEIAKTTEQEMMSSSLFLPNDSLRIKYLREREKLLKQFTADFPHSSSDGDGDGDEDGDGDNEDYYLQYKTTSPAAVLPVVSPVVLSPASGNKPTSSINNDDRAEAEAKVLPEEVAVTCLNNSRNNHEIINRQSTKRRNAYHQGGFTRNIPRKTNSSCAAGNLQHQPYRPSLSFYQTTPCPPSEQKGEAKKYTSKRCITWSKKTFDLRFEELKEFKRKYGHCNVPHTSTSTFGREYMHLGKWVIRIRDNIKKHLSSAETSGMYMDEEQMQRLAKIGFEVYTSVFSTRLQELKHFKKIHGHINVPRTGIFKSYDYWCSSVKRACRDFEAGRPLSKERAKASKMTSNRLEMLREIGFDW
jgi:hypothetical protein